MKKLLTLSFFTLTLNIFNTYAYQELATKRRMFEGFSLAYQENQLVANQLNSLNSPAEKIKQRIEEEKKQLKQKLFYNELKSLGYNEECIKFWQKEWGDMLPLGYPTIPLMHKPISSIPANNAPIACTYTIPEVTAVSCLNQPRQSANTTESTKSSIQSNSSYAGAHHVEAPKIDIPTCSTNKITKPENQQPLLNFAVKRWLLEAKKENEKEEDRIFMCDYCNATYGRSSDLKKHHYVCQIPLICNECNYNAGAQPAKLIEHLHNEHKTPYNVAHKLVHDKIKTAQEARDKKHQAK